MKKYVKYLIVVLIIVIISMYLKNKSSDYEYINIENNIQNNIEVMDENEFIKIHIIGEVKNSGVIELEAGSRVADAIEKAGGTTEMADVSKVNLACVLSDGEKLYIPNINEENNVLENELKPNKTNINISSKEELIKLNGIGDSTAEAIIDYRNKNGKFLKIEDLKNVPGIGDSKFEKIKNYICVK